MNKSNSTYWLFWKICLLFAITSSFSLAMAEEDIRLIVTLEQAPVFQEKRRLESLMYNVGLKSKLKENVRSYHQLIKSQQEQLVAKLFRRDLISSHKRSLSRLSNAVVIIAKASQRAEIAAMPGVKNVVIDSKAHTLLTESVEQIGATQLWSLFDEQLLPLTGHGITIAIVDSGIDYTHPDLGGCFGANCKVIGGYDFVNNDNDPMDDNGHGTLVAGIAAANGVLKGVAPDANLVAYKVVDNTGTGFESDFVAAMEAALDPDGNLATDDAVDIINISLGYGSVSDQSVASIASNEAVAAGVIVVVAAGNDGPNYNTINPPGNATDVITVGAVNKNGVVAEFSSRGLVRGDLVIDYPVIKPEIMAPGVDISTTEVGGGYKSVLGTSTAAPHIAGAAALLLQAHPSLNPAEIKALLVNNASPLTGDGYTVGNGLVDLVASYNAKIVISPPTINYGYVEGGVSNVFKERMLTIKNISNQTQQLTFAETGSLPNGSTISFEGQSFTLAPGEQTEQQLSLTVDPSVTSYLEDLNTPYATELTANYTDGSMRLPILFRRAEVLEVTESPLPTGNYALSGYAINAEGVQFHAARAGESRDPYVRFALRDETVSLFFENENSLRYYGLNQVQSTSQDVITFDATAEGYIVQLPTAVAGKSLTTQYWQGIFLHEDNPDFIRAFTHFRNPTFINVSEKFQFNYSAFLEEDDRDRTDKSLYFLTSSTQGILDDITFDLSGYGSVSFLVNNPDWFESGVRFTYLPTYYKSDGETRASGPGGDTVYYEPFVMTFHGKENPLAINKAYLNLRLSDIDYKSLMYSNEIDIGQTDYKKYVRSESDVEPAALVAKRTTRAIVGAGLRFFTSRISHIPGSLHIWPNINEQVGLTSILDSWGNAYADDLPFTLTCKNGEYPLNSGSLLSMTGAKIFTLGDGCESFELLVEYDGFQQSSSSALIEINVSGMAPRISMVELYSNNVLSTYVSSNGEIKVKIEDDGDISIFKFEFRVGENNWSELTAELIDNNYVIPLPAVDEVATASIRITAEDSQGNSIVNTIESAFIIGNNVEAIVDSDGDTVVDLDDLQPFHPLFIDAPVVNISVESLPVNDKTVAAGAKDIVMLGFKLASNVEGETLSSITLQASGDGNDSSDILAVNLYVDKNHDGALDILDTLLSTNAYLQDNGELQLDLAEAYNLPQGESSFLVTYDFKE